MLFALYFKHPKVIGFIPINSGGLSACLNVNFPDFVRVFRMDMILPEGYELEALFKGQVFEVDELMRAKLAVGDEFDIL